ncbi:MAG: hypothetical protein AAB914_04305, partial [Patescibacteria group bacterium]
FSIKNCKQKVQKNKNKNSLLLISRRKEATDAYQGKSYEFPTETSGSSGSKTQMAKLPDVLDRN